MLRFI